MIELIKLTEVQLLIDFIKNEWSPDHIFVKQPSLLLWQHECIFDDTRLNFIVSKNLSGQINGCLGVIPAQPQKDSLHSSLIWLAIWKSSSENKGTSVGLDLLSFANNVFRPRQVVSIGINTKVAKLYRALKYEVGFMRHYYIAGASVSKLLKTDDESELSQLFLDEKIDNTECNDCGSIGVSLSSLTHELEFNSINVLKNQAYINHRYLNHPSYLYHALEITYRGSSVARLVCRKLTINNESIIRVVDIEMNCMPGKALAHSIGKRIKDFLTVNKISYIDLVATSDVSKIASCLGFVLKKAPTVIPHHFEPFDPKNIDIMYAFRDYEIGSNKLFALKGDSDLDRPSLVS